MEKNNPINPKNPSSVKYMIGRFKMGKLLYITEKPSVAMEFIKILNVKGNRGDGYIEGDNAVFTWCVGHLVTMSYPEVYDAKLKKWDIDLLPFLPENYLYEVIPQVEKQFETVKRLLLREDIEKIYVCTDSGREGEYIYRLVDLKAGVGEKEKYRVWIDSQTEEEIIRGIKEAKPLSEYDALSDSAYLRAKEDYLIGINFSRLLTLLYGRIVSVYLKEDKSVIAVGRVMSCVLGMIVDREREIRNFVKNSFFKILGSFKTKEEAEYEGEWKVSDKSKYYKSELLYSESGFKTMDAAKKFVEELALEHNHGIVEEVNKTVEKKNAPLLFNLAELQNECSKKFKINPDQTLGVVQDLYERKMITYPRTDARVLSTAVAKEIDKNLQKLSKFNSETEIIDITKKIIDSSWHKGLEKTKYVDDKKITDHYAMIPTGEGLQNYRQLNDLGKQIYILIARRFLAIFYPPAKYSKLSIVTGIKDERFYTNSKVLIEAGYLEVLKPDKEADENENMGALSKIRKGQEVQINNLSIKEGETSPPKRYTSGTIILAMENAGKLIENEELREQIKSSGIGTSATRAEILKKLEKIKYIETNTKTQIIMPTMRGEMLYEVIKDSMPNLLNPELTASWEKGLKMVAQKEINSEVFMQKLEEYIKTNVTRVINNKNRTQINQMLSKVVNIKE